MKRIFSALMVISAVITLNAQTAELGVSLGTRLAGAGRITVPESGLARAEDTGLRFRTQFKVFVPAGRSENEPGFGAPPNLSSGARRLAIQPVATYVAETPASLACLYGVTSVTAGCNPMTLTTVASGGSRALAIVGAYDYPTALADLAAFSKQFGLPAPTAATFTVAYQGSAKPGPDPYCGMYGGWSCWAAEAALDIEMAHAMAPAAHIYLVEANSSSSADLLAAVKKAITLVQAAGGGEISMSWGGGEYSTETQSDATFTGTNVVFFAASGDGEGTIYPSVSPNVVAVGGTTVSRNPSTLAYQGEITWEDSGGGYSLYEPRPAFQSSISTLVGAHRGVPDVSAIGNPRSGVWVFDSFDNTVGGVLYGWNILGGSSVSAPLWAGIANHAGHFSASTAAEQTLIYSNAKTTAFRDVSYGTCGYYEGWSAVSGWDPCSGNGAPLGTAGK
jgi:subtilase family serine protease